MKSLKTAVGVACQVAFEYPDWGPEHVSDMLATYDATGQEVPCDYDELMELTYAADALRVQGKSFSEAESELIKTHKKGRRV